MTSGSFAHGWFNDFLGRMFGWSPEPEWLRVGAYLVHIIPIGYLYFAGGPTPRKIELSTQVDATA